MLWDTYLQIVSVLLLLEPVGAGLLANSVVKYQKSRDMGFTDHYLWTCCRFLSQNDIEESLKIQRQFHLFLIPLSDDNNRQIIPFPGFPYIPQFLKAFVHINTNGISDWHRFFMTFCMSGVTLSVPILLQRLCKCFRPKSSFPTRISDIPR